MLKVMVKLSSAAKLLLCMLYVFTEVSMPENYFNSFSATITELTKRKNYTLWL
jgi:hypothetical protein